MNHVRERGATAAKTLADRARTLLVLSATLLALTGCDGLFDVDNPTNIIDGDLEDPQLLDALGNSAEGSFSVAYDNMVYWGEMVGDAGFHASTRTSRLQLTDGLMDGWNETYEQVYNEMSQARWVADDMITRLEELAPSPNSDVRVARSYFFAGAARVGLATHFEEVTFDGNPPVTPAETLEEALTYFERSAEIAAAAGDASLEAGSYGAIARIHRALFFEAEHHGGGGSASRWDQVAQFAGMALSTDPGFNVMAHYAPPGSSNGIFGAYSTGNLYDSMDPRYANLVDPISGERDPRIEHTPSVGTASNGKEIYEQLKYDGYSSDVPVSRAGEAHLLAAEAAWRQGDLDGAVTHINHVRSAAGLPDFESDDAQEIMDWIVYERSVEMWLEGRRWPDHRYYEIIPPDWSDANKALGVHRRWPVSLQERDTNEYYRQGG